MPNYSENQKRIARLLLHKPKSAEELNQQLNIPYSKLLQELKDLLEKKAIEKEKGFPTRYTLKKDIVQEIKRRRELAETDKNKLRLRAIIETQSIEPELLKKQTGKLADAIKKDADFKVYALTQAPTLKQEEAYSSFLDVTLSIKDFKALIRFMYFFGPTTLEVLHPAKLELDAHELQEGLMDMAQMIHKYVQYLTKLLNRAELEDLNWRLLR